MKSQFEVLPSTIIPPPSSGSGAASDRAQAFTHMSAHALRRVKGRTRMSAHEIQLLLDKGLYVDTGRKPGFDRHHLVFYSQKDDRCFVAIRDEHTGTVVTVLPLAYQAYLAWPVSSEAQHDARRLAIRGPSARTLHAKAAETKKGTFHVSAEYVDDNLHLVTRFLAKFASEPYCGDHTRLLQDEGVLERLFRALTTLGVSPKSVLTLYVRSGAKEVAAIDLGS